MISLWAWLGLLSVVISLQACRGDKTEEVGKVESCDNGLYFSLKTTSCEVLKGHSLQLDSYGFKRIELANGLIVPQVINGDTPFSVSFHYHVDHRSAFDIVLKKLEFGTMLNDAYSEWAKVYVEPGEGIASVRLFPRGGNPIPPGKAVSQVAGTWIGDEGYVIELRGGDRFEDDDADAYRNWRVGGIAVDPRVADDPEGKIFILGDISIPRGIAACSDLDGSIQVVKTDIDLVLDFGLKEPGANWHSWGATKVAIPKGSRGVFPFHFRAADEWGSCPPPGPAVQVDPWKANKGMYLLQLDVFDANENVIKFDDKLYQGIRNAVGISVETETQKVSR